MALATNYVDDVLDGSQNEERVYNLKDADGNIIQANVSIDDISVYLQQGSVYSAELVNAQNTLLNQLEIDEIKDITITEWNSMSDAQKSAKNYCVVEDGKGKLYVKGKETSGDSITVLSRAEFNALPTAKQNKGAYYIYDADGSVFYNASQTAFDNTGTGMASGNVQQAIEELNSNITFTDLLDTATLPRDADRLGGQLPSYYATTDSLNKIGLQAITIGTQSLTANTPLDVNVDISQVTNGKLVLDLIYVAPSVGSQYITHRRNGGANKFRLMSSSTQTVQLQAIVLTY